MEYTKEDVPIRPETVVPDGCMEMIFHYGDPFSYSKRENQDEIQPSSFLGGQINRCLTITPTGDVGLIGVRFHPYGAAALLSLPMGELAGETIDLVDIVGNKAKELSEQIALAQERQNRILLIEGLLMKLYSDRIQADLLVEEAVFRVLNLKQETTVSELAKSLFISQRHLSRRFRHHVGLTIKSFYNIHRFQRLLRSISEHAEGSSSLTNAAYSAGYYDQSHLIKDFRRYTGTNPSEYLSSRHLFQQE